MITTILIEGMDCSGKSTLVNALKNHLHWDAKALGHQPGDQYQRYLKEYATLHQTVIDRGHISEVIFSSLFNRPTPFTQSELLTLNQVLVQRTLVIFAHPDLVVARQRYLDRHDPTQQITLDQLPKVHADFATWFNRRRLPNLLTYHSQDMAELSHIITQVDHLLQEHS